MKMNYTMTNEECQRFMQNIDTYMALQDDDTMIKAHEAGHMVLLKRYYPSNDYSYGWNDEKGVPCVHDRNDYDFSKVSVCKHHILVSLAGMVSVCKRLGMSRRDTQIVIDYFNQDPHSEGNDLWKATEFIRLLRNIKVKLDLFKLCGEAYDLISLTDIENEIDVQKKIQKNSENEFAF